MASSRTVSSSLHKAGTVTLSSCLPLINVHGRTLLLLLRSSRSFRVQLTTKFSSIQESEQKYLPAETLVYHQLNSQGNSRCAANTTHS